MNNSNVSENQKIGFFDKLYGNLKMSWLSVILFALAAGVYTGIVMMISPLKNTSFQDIGIAYEWWVIFAVIIVVNCKKSWDAMLKCFVFFLISQPIVYAVQIVAGTLAFDDGLGYYLHIWLPATVLTLPGGLIAYYCKKQNVFGAMVLGIGNMIQLLMGCTYIISAITDFPHHILSAAVCFVSAGIMLFFIQKQKKYRIISVIVTLLLAAALVLFVKLSGRFFVSNIF